MAITKFEIPEVLDGMKALNALKADIKSLLQLLLPFMGDWAQAEVNKARGDNNESFGSETRNICDISYGDTHLIFRCYHKGEFLGLQLIFKNDLGEKVVLDATCFGSHTPNEAATFRVEELSKWDVIPCLDYVMEMMVKLSERYPLELANEIAPFRDAAARKK